VGSKQGTATEDEVADNNYNIDQLHYVDIFETFNSHEILIDKMSCKISNFM